MRLSQWESGRVCSHPATIVRQTESGRRKQRVARRRLALCGELTRLRRTHPRRADLTRFAPVSRPQNTVGRVPSVTLRVVVDGPLTTVTVTWSPGLWLVMSVESCSLLVTA